MSSVHAVISDGPLDSSTVDEFVWQAESGAVVSFQGIVRDHDGGRGVVSWTTGRIRRPSASSGSAARRSRSAPGCGWRPSIASAR